MAWPITDWTTNPDWAAIANINAFIGAVRERQSALDDAQTPALANVGDDVQLASLWAGLQQWVEDNYAAFVQSHDAGVKRATTYHDDKDHDAYATLAALLTAAGAGAANWRRYTTHPDDGGSDLGGQMQAGDIIGPWVFEDLQKALNAMVWTQNSITYIDGASGGRYRGDRGTGSTWAVSKAGAEADWHALGFGPHEGPIAGTAGKWSYPLQSDDWQAHGERRTRKCKLWSAIGTGINRAIDWHVYTIAARYSSIGWSGQVETFDANGEVDASSNPITQDAWHRWRTESPAADVAQPESTDYIAAVLTTFPNWCQEPHTGGNADLQAQGWQTGNHWAKVRWDVAGGFDYT